MNRENRIKSIEELYDIIQENIIKSFEKDSEYQESWINISELEEKINKLLNDKDLRKLFDEYLTKEAEVIDIERKKAFKYGYNLSNRLIIDSYRE